MADVKWIKLTTDMFDNRKIKHLRRLPEGNNIVLIWVMLLTMAGRCNASGMIFLTENIPYTHKMLADELDFEENTVVLAMKALEDLDMIVTNNGYFTVAGWDEYQNTDRLQEIREYNRLAQQKSRAKRKALETTGDVNDKSMTSQRCHETDKEEDIDIDIEIDKKKKNKKVKESNHTLFARLNADFLFASDVYEKLSEWMAYKTAKKDTYTEQGLKVLLRKIENSILEYGAPAVCDLIDDSMANGWKGIIWDRLKKPTTQMPATRKSGNVFLDMLGDDDL